MSKDEYDRGVRDGLKSDEFIDFMDDMSEVPFKIGNEGYYKGREKGRQIRRERNTERKKEQRNRTRERSYSGYSGGGGGSSSPPATAIGAFFYVIWYSFLLLLGLTIAFLPVALVVDFLSYANHWGGGARATENRTGNVLGVIFIIGVVFIIKFATKGLRK